MFPKRLPIHDPESGVEHVLYIYMTHFKQMYGMLELVLFDFSGVKQVFIDRVYQESSCRVLTDEVQIYIYNTHYTRSALKVSSEAAYGKGTSRLDFLRKLRSFNACSKMLEIF